MTTTLTPEQFVPTMIAEWCRQVRRLHGAWSTPILGEDDLRVQRMREGIESATGMKKSCTALALRELADDPELAGKIYFEFWTDLPEPPLVKPDWAARHSYTMMWPQLTVTFESDPIVVGVAEAVIQQLTTITVDNIDTEHERVEVGSVHTLGEPMVSVYIDGIPHDFEASTSTLRQAAGALLLAADKFGGEN